VGIHYVVTIYIYIYLYIYVDYDDDDDDDVSRDTVISFDFFFYSARSIGCHLLAAVNHPPRYNRIATINPAKYRYLEVRRHKRAYTTV
jgi:hypothetical protein